MCDGTNNKRLRRYVRETEFQVQVISLPIKFIESNLLLGVLIIELLQNYTIHPSNIYIYTHIHCCLQCIAKFCSRAGQSD